MFKKFNISFFNNKTTVKVKTFLHLMPKVEKAQTIHVIRTNKAVYYIYNIDYLPGTNVNIWIERNGIPILREEIIEESWGTLGGDSFTSFVMSCLNETRWYIGKSYEHILEDRRIYELDYVVLTEKYLLL